LVPPWMVMVIGDALSSPAKRRKGKIDWKTRRILAADSALILMFRLMRFGGVSFGLNSNDELPTLQSVISAVVASARYCSEETCCALRPMKKHQPKFMSGTTIPTSSPLASSVYIHQQCIILSGLGIAHGARYLLPRT